jgi:hypothetical protein
MADNTMMANNANIRSNRDQLESTFPKGTRIYYETFFRILDGTEQVTLAPLTQFSCDATGIHALNLRSGQIRSFPSSNLITRLIDIGVTGVTPGEQPSALLNREVQIGNARLAKVL